MSASFVFVLAAFARPAHSKARPFIAQALAAAKRAGGGVSRSGRIVPGNRSRSGHGQRASIQANRLITSRSRGAVVKARVVRHSARATPLATHLNYLRREGVTRDGEKALTWSDLTDMCLLVPVGLEGPPWDLCWLKHIAANGGPTVQMCRASQATVLFNVQLGHRVKLADESYARTIASDNALWRPLDGENSVSSIRGIWLGSNPKRAVLLLVGLAKNMAAASQTP